MKRMHMLFTLALAYSPVWLASGSSVASADSSQRGSDGFSCSPALVIANPVSVCTCRLGEPYVEIGAEGTGPLAFQWQVRLSPLAGGWTDIAEGGPVYCDSDAIGALDVWADCTGSTSPQLSLTDLRYRHGAYFTRSVTLRCVVRNQCGSAVSGEATVSVCSADTDCSGTVDPADVATFVNMWLNCLASGSLDADFDNNLAIEPADVAGFLNAWLHTLMEGC